MTEYLPQLLRRDKWYTDSTATLDLNDLVWIVEPSSFRGQYQLGRVVEVFPGDDGIVRSAKVKTLQGTLHRPLVKLVPLPNGPELVPVARGEDVRDSETQ